jgi:phage baseplate assembly protein W
MAVQKAFSIEDGDLDNLGLRYKRNRPYKDIDLSFTPRPGPLDSDGTRLPADIFGKTDAAAVKQAVKNLILTNKHERPFQPNLGGALNEQLFEPNDENTADQIEDDIKQVLAIYEPRVKVLSVQAVPRQESRLNPIQRDTRFVLDLTGTMDVTILFRILATQEEVDLTVTLTRLR